MGVRLQGTYKTVGVGGTYNTILVEVLDNAGAGSTPVMFTLGGVTFNLNGEQRSLHGRFAAMTCTFEVIMDSTEVDQFAAALSSHDEERFFVKVYINSDIKFIGILTADGGQWDDLHRDASPTFRMIAMDGMGRLSGKNYADDSDNVYSGYEIMSKIIWKCLKNCGTKDHFTGPFFAILHDNVEDSQAVSGDPLINQRVNQDIFFERAIDIGTYNFKSCREVLQYICVAYNLCLKYIGPHYLFYNPKLLGGTAYAYDTSGEPSGTISVGATVTINNDKLLDANRKGISQFGVLPPLTRARITYDHGPQDVNMLYGVSYKGNNIPTPGVLPAMYSAGTVDVKLGELINLRFSGKLRIKSIANFNPPRFKNHRYHFKLFLNVVSPSNDFWWKMEYLPFDFYTTSFSNFGHAIFEEGGPLSFDVVTDIIDELHADLNIFSQIGFDTTILSTGNVHEVYFSFQFFEVFDEKLDTVVGGGGNPALCEWEFSDLELVAVEDGSILKRPTKTVSESIGNPKNSDYLEEVTLIGDGPMKTSNSRIQIYDGAEWKDSKQWGGLKLHRKSVKDIAEARTTALKLLLGGYYAMSAWFDSIILYNGVEYFPMSLQYITGPDEWVGELVQIGSSGSGITTKDKKVLIRERLPLPDNPNDLPDDERLEDRILKIVTIDAYTSSGGPYSTITMRDPAKYDYLFRKGDVINIIDPVIGYVNDLTLTQHVKKGDTTVSITPWTPDQDFPPGSYIELEKQFIDANRHLWIYQWTPSFTGSTWDIVNDGEEIIDSLLLPDEATFTRAEYSVLVYLFKSGQKLMYLVNISTDTEYHKGFYSTKALDQIHFYEPCTGQPLEIYIQPINL